MTILTCNIRTALADDGPDNWENRREICARVIRSRDPDLIGFQEMDAVQFHDLMRRLEGYESYGLGDTAGPYRPANAIFFRRDRFRLVTGGGYWLSETPHIPGSSSWESRCVRVANWVRLVERSSDREFRFINTHLDHISQPARENQARLILEDGASYPSDFPQVLVGDMNCDGQNPALQQLFAAGWRDTFQAANGNCDPGPTIHHFKGEADDRSRGKIDWILTRGDWETIAAAEIIRDSENGRFPSDHYFVSCRCILLTPDRQ